MRLRLVVAALLLGLLIWNSKSALVRFDSDSGRERQGKDLADNVPLVTFRVVDSVTGMPIEGATLSLRTFGHELESGCSDEDGLVPLRFAVLEGKPLHLRCTHPDCEPLRLLVRPDWLSHGDRQLGLLRKGQRQTAVIECSVDHGEPFLVSGEWTIVGGSRRRASPWSFLVAPKDGILRISLCDVPVGASLSLQITGQESGMGCRILRVFDGTTPIVSRLMFRKLRGRVEDEDGRGQEGVRVRLIVPHELGRSLGFTSETDALGTYELVVPEWFAKDRDLEPGVLLCDLLINGKVIPAVPATLSGDSLSTMQTTKKTGD